MFPEVHYRRSLTCRILNEASQRVVCVRSDLNKRAMVLTTKPVDNELQGDNGEDIFKLDMFTSAKPDRLNMTVIWNEASGTCIYLADDDTLTLRPLVEEDQPGLNVAGDWYPEGVKVADRRFFYIRRSGLYESPHVLQGAVGDLWWSLSDNGEDLVMRQRPESVNFPRDMKFDLEKVHNSLHSHDADHHRRSGTE